MAGAHRDAFEIEKRTDIVRMNIADHERQYRGFIGGGAVNFQAGNLLRSFGRIRKQSVFVFDDSGPWQTRQIINCRAKPDNAGN